MAVKSRQKKVISLSEVEGMLAEERAAHAEGMAQLEELKNTQDKLRTTLIAREGRITMLSEMLGVDPNNGGPVAEENGAEEPQPEA